MSVTLTISVDDPRDLAAAVATLASSLGSAVAPTVAADSAVPAEAAPARRGRKTKEQPEAPTAPETPAAATEPAAVTTSAAPPATPAPAVSPAPTPAPAAVEVPATVSKKDVQDLLIAAMKQFGGDGRAIVGAICRAHGGPNLSALAESTYPALYRDAKALLEMSADQAKATYLAVAA